MVIRAALDPTIARKARRGEIRKCIDHFGLLKIGDKLSERGSLLQNFLIYLKLKKIFIYLYPNFL